MYSSENSPFGPITLLATTWQSSKDLAGYAQQDAHEFFISALNQIHTSSRGSTNVSCNCVIHNVFAGQLQSDVKCEKCGNIVNTVEPLLDISLELSNPRGAHHDNTLTGCLKRLAPFTRRSHIIDLTRCLRSRYTQPEKLNSKYTCSKCSTTSQVYALYLTLRLTHNSLPKTATKRLSIKKLPPVLSFQLKVTPNSNDQSSL